MSARKKKTTTTKDAAKKKAARKKVKARTASTPKVGSTISRVFKGKTYALRVTAGGYKLGKKTFTSLTAAAKAITKYPSISGPRFFGLTERKTKGGA